MSIEQITYSTNGFTMTIMSKVWRDEGDILVITKKQNAPNRYSRVYLVEGNICDLSVCN